MPARIIDGKTISEQVNAETAAAAALLSSHGVRPGIAVILVGEDPASQVYVGSKERKAKELGFHSLKIVLPASASQAELLAVIARLNADPAIHGILVQSPVPRQIDERAVILAIDPGKDVDCFHPYNVGKMLIGDTDGFLPCTPWGVMELLRRSGIDAAGRHAVVIGRSTIVGKPMMALLMQKAAGADATVTVCHSRTPDIGAFTRQADIIVSAIGKANFLKADMVKPGAVVIDVGINRIADPGTKSGFRLVGDVDFAPVAEKAGAITPVPGGVGPMTIAMLMGNTLRSAVAAQRKR
ncbi:MAG: bifunctional 5,10-methylene-tetrahydrofolate dehydrogenase/5,10-methylene-tetrahydrofolate cyclohydrolase [Planctomycetes bacterium]|nr:bifunctional 5,10-methylene-tetrahydrofolate dehydrogenase/5,10-methylene-tetrahydrofolate cyclohydrolase [Planctomycetota bacterium]